MLKIIGLVEELTKQTRGALMERISGGLMESPRKVKAYSVCNCARTINMKRFIFCSECFLVKCELNECWPAFYLSFNFTLFVIQMLIKWWGNCKSLSIRIISSFSMDDSLDPSLPHDVRAFDAWRRKRCDRWFDIELKQQKGHFRQSLLLKSCYGNWNEWKLEDGWINGVNKTGHKSRQGQEKEGRQAK